MKRILAFLFCSLITLRALAIEPNDTVKFHYTQIIAPAALITTGSLFVSIKPLVQARKWVNNDLLGGVHRCGPYDDYLQYLPLASYVGLEYCGVKCRRPIVDRLIVGVTATVVTNAVGQTMKYTVREPRPIGAHNSFPSGHSMMAFMGAELLRQDYGTWVGVGGYTVATAVGVMRMLNGAHWFNDVLCGAGVGILGAWAGQWMLPFNRRWLGLNRRGAAMALMPSASPDHAAIHAALVF